METALHRGPTRLGRAAELALVFFALPGVLALSHRTGLDLPVIPCLVALTLLVLIVLLRDPGFDRRALGRGHLDRAGGVREAARVLALFVPAAIGLVVVTRRWAPELWLEFPRSQPLVWAAVMLLYPLLSAYPQEVLFRVWFERRATALVPGYGLRLALGALAFGWAHIVFGSWVSVVLTAVGGLLFAWTYARTGSALAAAVEHSLYGCLIFTIGLGRYFYAGAD